jgi:hypothetical protein
MSITDEGNTLLGRAEKWLRRIDDKEYKALPEFSLVEIPDIEGNRFPFSQLLSRAMGNYQVTRDFYAELLLRAKEGSLTGNLAFMSNFNFPKEVMESVKAIQQSKKGQEDADRSILESFKLHRTISARNFLYYIDYGLASGYIGVGEATERKLTEAEKEKQKMIEERNQLQSDFDEVSEQLVSLRALYDECQRKLHIQPFRGQNPASQ